MSRLAAAFDWLVRMEKHPSPVRYQNRIWWRWRWERMGLRGIDRLPPAVAQHLPKGNSPHATAWSTRRKALNAAATAVYAATRAGWEPTRIL